MESARIMLGAGVACKRAPRPARRKIAAPARSRDAMATVARI
jgi:hypothetical protein